MKKNQQGSTLVYAIVVIMILTITIAAGMTISFTYYRRSIDTHTMRQAYLSAKSVLTNIVDNIITVKNQEYIDLIPANADVETTQSYAIQDFPEEMGSIMPLYVSRTKKTIKEETLDYVTFTVSVTFAEKTKTINADMAKKETEVDWQFLKYYEGEIPININIANATKMRSLMLAINDLYLSTGGGYSNKDVLKMLTVDNAEAYAKVMKAKPTWKFGYNDDILRTYFFHGYFDGAWPIFDKTVVKDGISAEARAYLDKETYYIQPYFTHSTYKNCVVYANAKKDPDEGSKNWVSNLIFNPEDGHWYYTKSKFSVTELADNSNGDSLQNWESFKIKYLSDAERLD